MRNRRVGTVSMGVVLAAVGILLLYAQFNAKTSVDLLVKWWPAILFLLGTEILLYTYLAKEEHPKIKYDIFSIFIVFILVFCSAGIYGLTQTGIMQRVNMMISAQNFVLEMPVEEVALDDSIKKVIVNTPLQSTLSIRTSTDNNISAFGMAYVTADTRETAEKMLKREMISSHQIGDTLYISFNHSLTGNDFSYHTRIREYTLIIPSKQQVEIKGDYHLELMVDSLENDWLIDINGTVDIRVNNKANLAIETLVRNPNHLKGNVDWLMDEDDQDIQAQNFEELIEGKAIFGEGKYKITTISNSAITVNRI